MAGNANSGQKSLNDRKLSAEVRMLTLNKIKIILQHALVDMTERDRELHDALLVKLAGTVLPRLNEHTGEDGAPLNVQVIKFDEFLNGKPPEEKGNNVDGNDPKQPEAGQG